MPNHTLEHIQKNVQAYILQQDETILAEADEQARPRLLASLEIYADGYFARICNLMERDYPYLSALMGEEAFTSLITDYVDEHPSHEIAIQYFGCSLAAFLRQQTYQTYTCLAELAEWEYSLIRANLAPDCAYLSTAELSTIREEEWSQLRVAFHPSLQFLQLTNNMDELIHCPDGSLNPELLPPTQLLRLEKARHTRSHDYFYMSWRKDLDLYRQAYPVEQAQLLSKAMDGVCFAEWPGVAEGNVEPVLSTLIQWMQWGLITELRFA